MMKWQLGSLCTLCLLLFTPAMASAVETVHVTLQNGDLLSGELVDESDQEIILHHSILGILTIPKKQLRSDSSLHSAEKEIPVTDSSTKMAPKLLGVFGTDFLEGWTRSTAFGIKGEGGNDVSMDLSFSLDASYRDDADRLEFSSAYYYETEDREKDTSKGHVNFVRDWLFPESEWFYYGYFRYEYDSFKLWKNRVSLSGGSGYDFYRDETLDLSGRLGLGVSRSWGTENEYNPEGQIGMEWRWSPRSQKNQSYSSQFIIYPLLNEIGEYRTWIQAKWEIDLDILRGIGLELGFEHEYESKGGQSIDDEKDYDLIYYGRISLDF